MTSGDARRVWYPEMLETLRSTWSVSMSWEELADFCRRMTEMRKTIRQSRKIEPPRTRCPRCGAVSQADIAGVTIRSALFALKKSGVISEDELEKLDKSWRRRRAEGHLDAYGRRSESPREESGGEAAPRCHVGAGRPARGA